MKEILTFSYFKGHYKVSENELKAKILIFTISMRLQYKLRMNKRFSEGLMLERWLGPPHISICVSKTVALCSVRCVYP